MYYQRVSLNPDDSDEDSEEKHVPTKISEVKNEFELAEFTRSASMKLKSDMPGGDQENRGKCEEEEVLAEESISKFFERNEKA